GKEIVAPAAAGGPAPSSGGAAGGERGDRVMRFLPGRLVLIAGAAWLLLAGAAPRLHAQYNPYFGGFFPYYSGFGPGATLQGAASVLDAQGSLMRQQEQARILREQANQAKVAPQKTTFDFRMYERANPPSYTEEKESLEARRIRRMMGMANANEITGGITLNTFLPFLARLMNQGYTGPTVPLDPDLLKH